MTDSSTPMPVPTAGSLQRLHFRYVDVRDEIDNGTVLLFRTRGALSRPIQVGGRSPYRHAAMAGWWFDRLMLLEMTAGGGRAVLLSNVLPRYSGSIDVFDVLGNYHCRKAVQEMIAITAVPYGWLSLARMSLVHLPGVRWLVRPDLDDRATGRWPPVCSEAVSRALRRGGVDPVPNLADRQTEPGDLGRSAALAYRFTLLW